MDLSHNLFIKGEKYGARRIIIKERNRKCFR